MRIVCLALAAFALAACQTPCPATVTGPTSIRLACEDGAELAVTFTRQPDSARIEQEGYSALELPARVTGSGYRYSEEGAELRGRGSEARFTRPGAGETICTEIVPG